MSRFRIFVWILLTVTLPVETFAAASAPAFLLAGSHHEMNQPMDCHDPPAPADDPAVPCCIEGCPDMIVCAFSAVAIATDRLAPMPLPDAAPEHRALTLHINPPPSLLFRPPAVSRA